MPNKAKDNKGIIIFLAIVLIFIAAGIAAYLISGDKGIEERFSRAVGLGGGTEEGEGGFLGFSIEGNVLVYAIILILLIIVCAILLKVFKI